MGLLTVVGIFAMFTMIMNIDNALFQHGDFGVNGTG